MVAINDMTIRQLRNEARRQGMPNRGKMSRKEDTRRALVAHVMRNKGFGCPVVRASLPQPLLRSPLAETIKANEARRDYTRRLIHANRTLSGLLVYMLTVAACFWLMAL